MPKKVFLGTIKILKYEAEKEPVLVKEILCDNNLKPVMDYGPSVAFFSGCIYYFKRIYKSESQTLQMFKYNFDQNEECQVSGVFFDEEEDVETKIQFFE